MVSAQFENYRKERWYWFAAYLELAALICEHPELSVHNNDFKSFIEDIENKKQNASDEYRGLWGKW